MDTHVLEYILVIAQEQSISRAADKVHLTQSALSQSIAKEEKELGTTLFSRSGRKVVPTPEGEIYLAYAKEMIEIKNETYNLIHKLNDERKHLRIVTAGQFESTLKKKLIPALCRQFPDLEYDIINAPSQLARQYLQNDLADIGFLCMQKTESSLLRCHPLYKDCFCAAIPYELLTDEIKKNGLPACSDVPFILPSKTSTIRTTLENILIDSGMQPYLFKEIDDISSTAELVRRGICAAFLPSSMRDDDAYYMMDLSPDIPKYTVVCAVPNFAPPSEERDALLILAGQQTYN